MALLAATELPKAVAVTSIDGETSASEISRLSENVEAAMVSQLSGIKHVTSNPGTPVEEDVSSTSCNFLFAGIILSSS